MNVDTGQFRAITAENARLQSDVTLLIHVAARAADALDAAEIGRAHV